MGHARGGMQSGSNDAAEDAKDPLHGIPYRATRMLGQGGAAVVYEARPRAGGRRVAIKMLRPSLAASEDAIERMRIEAESLLCLDHPNIVRVLDFGRAPDGCPYLVEERLYGRSLHKEIIARGPLPALEAAEYVTQLLAGLEVVHRLGIVHRDLKLSNLFLVRNKERGTRWLKMLDFGFAKVLRMECSRARPKPMPVSTRGDLFLGTPRFAAPEQIASGWPLGPAADLYTAGLVLYSLLAGREPFCEIARETDLLMAQVQKDLGSPARHASEPIAAEIEAFLRKAVEKHPDDRFASATEMKEALGSLCERMRLTGGAAMLLAATAPEASVVPVTVRSDRHACTTVRWDAPKLVDWASDECSEEQATGPEAAGLEAAGLEAAVPEPAAPEMDATGPERPVSVCAVDSEAKRAPCAPSPLFARPAAEATSLAVENHVHPRARALLWLATGLGVLLSLATILWIVWCATPRGQ